ncbi:hypothetical protein F0562_001911 [Nyssa sinensis]|uniref:HhH-GPD domain-containing protein n=1 Tax=Nyssa sinensis TaxID=561372 RepID=A0A5J5C8E8_9ASTE|nr:hypothetical protein F0562_001911 [Nyssa sinensis]
MDSQEKAKMEFGESHKEGVCIPVTPEKSNPVRLGQVSSDKERKSHLGTRFSAENWRESVNFSTTISTNKEEVVFYSKQVGGNGFDSASMMDLNRKCYSADTGKQERLNEKEEHTCLGCPRSFEVMEGQNVGRKSFDLMASGRGVEDCGVTFDGLNNISFTELLRFPATPPSSEKTASRSARVSNFYSLISWGATEIMRSCFFHDDSPQEDTRNNASSPVTQVPRYDRLNQEKDQNEVLYSGNEGSKLPSTAVPTSPEKWNVNGRKRSNNGLDLKLRPKKFWPKIADEGRPIKIPIPKPSTPKPQTPKFRRSKYARKKSVKASDSEDEPNHSGLHPAKLWKQKDNTRDEITHPNQRKEVDKLLAKREGIAIDQKNPSDSSLGVYWRKENELKVQDLSAKREGTTADQKNPSDSSLRVYRRKEKELMVEDSLKKREGTTTDRNNPNDSCLRVYRRMLQANQCLKNSRKLGPNCPGIFKKGRMKRRKAAQAGQRWVKVKKVRSRRHGRNSHWTSTTIDRKLAPEFIPKNGVKNLVHIKNFLRMISPTEAQSIAAINDPESFKCMLSLSPIVKYRTNRSKNPIRRPASYGSQMPQMPPTPPDVSPPDISPPDVSQLLVQDLVPYKGNKHKSTYYWQQQIQNLYGTLVSYEANKHKSPPKVDYWKLLIENENGESEVPEQDDERWEEQRKVFHGRVNSFITRMFVIQGDRHFSPWKGSVLDSVVGVFLTQNVTDNSSSSAFMSLAARFPLQSTNKGCDEDGEMKYSQESVGSNVEAFGKQSRSNETEKTVGHAEINRASRDVISVQNLMDRATDGNSTSTIENSTCFPEFLQLKETDFVQEFYENEKLSWDESGIGRNTDMTEIETRKQGSSFNASVCSASSHNPCSNVSLAPSDQEDPCGSLGKCQVSHESSPQVEARTEKNINESKNRQKDKMILQSGILKSESTRKNKRKSNEKQEKNIDWDALRRTYSNGIARESTGDTMDSVNWEKVRRATVDEVANAIAIRGMNNRLAERIKDFLDRVVKDHGSLNLEWLRDVPPDKAKEYLLSIGGLGLKSVECLRLLTLHHVAFPVDTNVGRVAVRLGWVPLKPLPEEVQLHLLETYPMMNRIQQYLWPRLCTLDQRTLYELHYQMITFGKVFCRKKRPNCNACPMKGECKHYASAFASVRLALPGTQEKSMVSSKAPAAYVQDPVAYVTATPLSLPEANFLESRYQSKACEPIIEHPASPGPEYSFFDNWVSETIVPPGPEYSKTMERDIEDFFCESEDEDEDEILHIRLYAKVFKESLRDYWNQNNVLCAEDMSKALAVLPPAAASRPVPKLKHAKQSRTEHQVYELPDSHPLLLGLDRREPDDPCPYLLAIHTTDGFANSCETPKKQCNSQESEICNENSCSSCNNTQEQNFLTVYGTILIPCRTAQRGSFPLNGTYFQVNEVFADDESSQNPISVPTAWIWNLPRRTLYCATSTSAIFRGSSTEEIQACFWRGFVCVRAFNRKTREPKPLGMRFHLKGKTGKTKITDDEKGNAKMATDNDSNCYSHESLTVKFCR